MVNDLGARRAEIAPFLAMDVMEAARRVESTGAEVARLEVGQPGSALPRVAREARGAGDAEGTPLGYTWRWGCRNCASGSRRCIARFTGSTCPPAGS